MRYGKVVLVCIPFLLSGVYAAEKRKDKKSDRGTIYTNARSSAVHTNARSSAVHTKKEETYFQEKKDSYESAVKVSAVKAFVHHDFEPVKSKHEGVRTLLRGKKRQNQKEELSYAKKSANYDIKQIKGKLHELMLESAETRKNVPLKEKEKKILKIVHAG